MDQLLKLFEIDQVQFNAFLQVTRGGVAGSAALWAIMLEQRLCEVDATSECRWCDEGCEICSECIERSKTDLKWTPGDIDIWIPLPGITKEDCRDSEEFLNPSKNYTLPLLTDIVTQFMSVQNYKRLRFCDEQGNLPRKKPEDSSFANYFDKLSVKWLCKILNFKNAAGQSVQIMFTSDMQFSTIRDSFDLSVCQVMYLPQNGFKSTSSSVLANIKDRQAYVLTEKSTSTFAMEQLERRCQKYRERGFEVMKQGWIKTT